MAVDKGGGGEAAGGSGVMMAWLDVMVLVVVMTDGVF